MKSLTPRLQSPSSFENKGSSAAYGRGVLAGLAVCFCTVVLLASSGDMEDALAIDSDGNIQVKGSLTVNGDTVLNGKLDVSDAFNVGSPNSNANTVLNGSLTGGRTTLRTLDVVKGLAVNTSSEADDTPLTVNGEAEITGTLVIDVGETEDKEVKDAKGISLPGKDNTWTIFLDQWGMLGIINSQEPGSYEYLTFPPYAWGLHTVPSDSETESAKIRDPLARVLALEGRDVTRKLADDSTRRSLEVDSRSAESIPGLTAIGIDRKGARAVESPYIALLVEAIKEQQAMIEKQQDEIAAIRAELDRIHGSE